MTNVRPYIRIAVLCTALLVSSAVQACQLVCIIAAGNLDDTGCSAAKTGFKLAKPGMLASLPQKGPEYYGSSSWLHGGISCSDVAATSAMQMPWIAQGYGSGWPVEAVSGSVSAASSWLPAQCNSRYSSHYTVCCNM